MENNILYLANLKALEAWYTHVRKHFFEAQEFGSSNLCRGDGAAYARPGKNVLTDLEQWRKKPLLHRRMNRHQKPRADRRQELI
ncbi:MAG: hypothetical protein MZU91_01075 [Desulfosudis oleivorans]|nr:hypothetical protein [Desulfosudis oleivorans]